MLPITLGGVTPALLSVRPGFSLIRVNERLHTMCETDLSTPVEVLMTQSQSISAYGPARATVGGTPRADELRLIQRYWQATLFMSAGMIYLRDNPLLREPLKPEHIKRRLLGHWGSDPGQSLRPRSI